MNEFSELEEIKRAPDKTGSAKSSRAGVRYAQFALKKSRSSPNWRVQLRRYLNRKKG